MEENPVVSQGDEGRDDGLATREAKSLKYSPVGGQSWMFYPGIVKVQACAMANYGFLNRRGIPWRQEIWEV